MSENTISHQDVAKELTLALAFMNATHGIKQSFFGTRPLHKICENDGKMRLTLKLEQPVAYGWLGRILPKRDYYPEIPNISQKDVLETHGYHQFLQAAREAGFEVELDRIKQYLKFETRPATPAQIILNVRPLPS